MHILLTDLLVCPRCGPPHGLILLADRIEERRVLEGTLGCANCRETYPIAGGALDLRTADSPAVPAPHASADEGEAVRLAALMGLAGASGTVGAWGFGAELASAVAALVPGVEVVAATPGERSAPPGARVSPIAVDAGSFPFRSGALRALAVRAPGPDDLPRAVRVVAPGGRLVVTEAHPTAADRLREAGAEVLLAQEDVVVARAPRPPGA